MDAPKSLERTLQMLELFYTLPVFNSYDVSHAFQNSSNYQYVIKLDGYMLNMDQFFTMYLNIKTFKFSHNYLGVTVHMMTKQTKNNCTTSLRTGS